MQKLQAQQNRPTASKAFCRAAMLNGCHVAQRRRTNLSCCDVWLVSGKMHWATYCAQEQHESIAISHTRFHIASHNRQPCLQAGLALLFVMVYKIQGTMVFTTYTQAVHLEADLMLSSGLPSAVFSHTRTHAHRQPTLKLIWRCPV